VAEFFVLPWLSLIPGYTGFVGFPAFDVVAGKPQLISGELVFVGLFETTLTKAAGKGYGTLDHGESIGTVPTHHTKHNDRCVPLEPALVPLGDTANISSGQDGSLILHHTSPRFFWVKESQVRTVFPLT